MSSPLRLIFDDCLSKNAVAALQNLAAFSHGAAEFAHLVHFGLSGEVDDVWVPRIARDEWVLVSTDRGKKKSRGGKLPLLCQAAGLSYILLSAAVHKRSMFDKVRAILSVWPQLIEIQPGKPCRGYLIQVHSKGGDSVILRTIWPPEGEEGPRMQRGLEFGLE